MFFEPKRLRGQFLIFRKAVCRFLNKIGFPKDLWCLRSPRQQGSQTHWQKNPGCTGENLLTFYLFQSISMAIQRGSAVCVMGCPKDNS